MENERTNSITKNKLGNEEKKIKQQIKNENRN